MIKVYQLLADKPWISNYNTSENVIIYTSMKKEWIKKFGKLGFQVRTPKQGLKMQILLKCSNDGEGFIKLLSRGLLDSLLRDN